MNYDSVYSSTSSQGKVKWQLIVIPCEKRTGISLFCLRAKVSSYNVTTQPITRTRATVHFRKLCLNEWHSGHDITFPEIPPAHGLACKWTSASNTHLYDASRSLRPWRGTLLKWHVTASRRYVQNECVPFP